MCIRDSSIENQEILQNVFPEFKNKIMIIENMISEKEILKASNEKILDFPKDVFTNISVGRIVEAKLHTIRAVSYTPPMCIRDR